MEGQVLLTNYDLDPGGSNPNAIATGYYQAHHHHHNHHPELEHLAQTMPKPTVMNSYENETNNNGSTNSSNNNIRSQSRMSISHDKGLLNMPGQNNCFLNSAVQVLWHLDIFRRSFRELHGHACMGDSCIFCALKELFNQFQSSTESALPPDSLRFALSQAFSDQRRFQIKEMDDAAECFENILFRIHYHITNRELDSQSHCLPHCIPHQKFSMNLYEQIVCYSCGATSDPFLFSQMVHYTSTSALCVQQQIHNDNHHHHHHHHQNNDDDNKAKFGQLLKKASSMGDIRNCPKMCGARMNIKKILLNRPDIISIGLVWDTDHPSISFIKNVYHLIETEILLSDIFDIDDTMDPTQPSQPQYSQSSRNKKLDLVGLVTYYGKHYSTYIFNTKLSQWIYFDDATVRVVGQHWQQVVDKCIKGHFQPLLLFYSNPNATSINTQYASSDIIPMTIIKKPEHVRPPPITTATSPPTSFQAQKHLRDKIMAPSSDPNLCLVDYKFNHKQQQQQQQPHSDVPDSPSATSTTSYFSEDVGDSTDGYISRKTVENIIKIQQRNSKKHQQQQQSQKADTRHTTMVNNYNNRNFNRNSSSSLESFDSVVRQLQSNVSSKMMLHTHSNEHHHHQQQQPTISKTICSLQRRDSGNSSGDRASSASSNETPYYPQKRLLKMSSTIVSSQKNPSLKNVSDQGYDSFSLSSSDSYPSTAATSPSKLNSRLKQIPEDVQLIDMVNNLSMDDCDKLCSEADILLLRSHEKEREGDLRAAAALSDSAAAKARSAMDIPYSNHQTLISAKMKHSMCVMRSASLHKRLLEMEVEEKRLLKAAMQAEQSQHHSRQSSRDSSHGRHSRQGSRDGKDVKSTKDVSATITASTDTKANAHKDSRWPSPFNLEIYATLPKKVKRKSQQKDNNFIITKSNENVKNAFNNVDECQKIYENVTIANQSKTTNKSAKSGGKNLIPDSDFSDYHSEWEAIKKKKPQFKIETQITYQNGWQSCRENDSEGYAEFGGTLQKPTNNGKKQCKVKRKLMFGNFLKTKNRSLPDLREEMLKDKTNEGNNNTNTNTNANQNKSNNDHNRCSVANINAKGFHQSHRSFVAEQGFKSKPLLIKVKPPLLSLNENSIIGDKKMSNINIGQHQSQPPTSSVGCSYEDKIDQSSTMPKRNLFLEELNRKRSEILKFNGNTINNREDRPTTTTNASVRSRSSDSDCNPNLFSSTPSPRLLKTASPPVVIKKPSLFEIANLISKNRTTNPNLCHNQPLESIIIQNHGHNQEQWPSNKSMATPIHSNLHVPIPVNPVINTTPAAVACGTKALRMQKPPDYETTLKRIEMNNKVVNVNDPPKINSNINNKLDRTTSSPQQRQQPTSSSPSPIYSNMSSLQTHKLMRDIQPEYEKSTISNGLASAVSTPINGNHFLQPTINNDNLPQQQQQPQLKRPQPSNFINGANFTEHPFDDTKNDSSLSNHHLDATKQQAKNQRNNSKSNAMNNKKSVKFSDHIELVACADDDEQEEPLPNLLLEKVLIGKNLIYTLQQ